VAELHARLLPAYEEEAALGAERLAGRTLDAAGRADVSGRTRLTRVTLWRLLFNEFGVPVSHPDGVARDDLSIELFAKRGWRRYPDPVAHFRALFAHEYTHRLQYEGEVSRRWGVEVMPVAVELLRGIELVGLEALRAGRIPFIAGQVLDNFDSGRRWAEGDRADGWTFVHKGALAGAAFGLAERTGRWSDAWEFLRRTGSQRSPEEPAAVFSDILAR
ncbi:MAG: hypothetical protein KGL53_02040, partial [Elusimicrobia bacterium]|nr:hypothetical protein [Elusimicrobiota bacterium]